MGLQHRAVQDERYTEENRRSEDRSDGAKIFVPQVVEPPNLIRLRKDESVGDLIMHCGCTSIDPKIEVHFKVVPMNETEEFWEWKLFQSEHNFSLESAGLLVSAQGEQWLVAATHHHLAFISQVNDEGSRKGNIVSPGSLTTITLPGRTTFSQTKLNEMTTEEQVAYRAFLQKQGITVEEDPSTESHVLLSACSGSSCRLECPMVQGKFPAHFKILAVRPYQA